MSARPILPVGESRQSIKVRGQIVPITHFEHNEGLEKAIEKGFGEMCNYKHCQYGKTCRRLHARNVSGGQTNNSNRSSESDLYVNSIHRFSSAGAF